MNQKRERYREPDGKIWFPFGILALGVLLGFYGVIYGVDHILPTPLEIKDEIENPNSFIAERARDFLKPLVDIGPKVTGHESNEILAVEYLKETINEIKSSAHSNQEIELDVQVISGSFYLDYKPYGSTNVYANIQNVVVKIYSETNSSDSILINTHFDTVPNSPGGSDDGINVAVCLEILRKLSQSTTKPKHNIIFLFNGAEEAGLCGSHGFIQYHKWAPEVVVLINLEATGGGGREILFQTGPDRPWLLKYYMDVPHPHGNAAGEEVFQSNIIPSDTDFRIFRDFYGIIGYDFAFTRDGYRYHTKYDGFDNIEYGRFQHTGDNILHLIRNLAEAPEVANPNDGYHKTVFFDVLGWFFVYYSVREAIIINSIISAVSIIVMVWSCIKLKLGNIFQSALYLAMLTFVILLGWVIAIAFVVLVATILDATNRSMSWYSVPTLHFGLFATPVCIILLGTRAIINKVVRHKRLTMSMKAIIQVHTNRLLWTILLVIGTILGVRLVYVIMIGILFNTITMLIVHLLSRWKGKFIDTYWPVMYIISTIIPTMIFFNYGHEVVALFIPILGRFGSDINPDLILGIVVAFFTILIVSNYVPLFMYIKKPWYVVAILGGVFIATIILVYTPVGFPYTSSEDHPKLQRYYVYHTERTMRDDNNQLIKKDAGFYFTKMDRNVPHSIRGEVTSMEKAISLKHDCDLVLACGLPITNSRSLQNLEDSIWIPAQKPIFSSDIEYSYKKKEKSPTTIEFTVSVKGSDRIDVYLSTRKEIKLIDLSLLGIIPEYARWNGQRTYYFSFVYGKTPAPFTFTFTVETPQNWPSPLVDLAMVAKFVHDDKNEKTDEYQKFLEEFPEWTVFGVTGLAQYENVVLV